MAKARIEELVGYGAVEAALVQAYRIPSKAVGAFRGRIGSLQKGGLFGPRNRPGKGVALRYGPDQFHRLVFACEMLELGTAPAVVLSLVKELWDRRLRGIFKDAETAAMREPGPHYIVLYFGGARLMSDTFSDAIPNVNACPLSKLPDHIERWMSMQPDDRSELPPRAMITNLSMRLRAFHDALATANWNEMAAESKS